MKDSTKKWVKTKAFRWWIAPNLPSTPGTVRDMVLDGKKIQESVRSIRRDVDTERIKERVVEKGDDHNAALVGARTATRIARLLFGSSD